MTARGSSERPDWPTAVVVGAGGLGMAVARRLGLSHRLLLADCDADHVETAAAMLRAAGYDATGVACDVTQAESVARLAEAAAARPKLQALAHVVGLSPAAGDFGAILSVNLVGADRIAATFVDLLKPGGAAVFISSSAAHMQDWDKDVLELIDGPRRQGFVERLADVMGDGATANGAYAVSKHGLNRMCRRAAPTWGRRGLRIVSLSPGLIATPQGAESYRHSTGKAALLDAVPAGRECTMLEIAGIVDFLLSDRASYITGTDILADGGLISAVRPPA